MRPRTCAWLNAAPARALLRDILLVNLLPVALIFAALFYLDQYQQGLLAAEVSALREQARIYAGALAQTRGAGQCRRTRRRWTRIWRSRCCTS